MGGTVSRVGTPKTRKKGVRPVDKERLEKLLALDAMLYEGMKGRTLQAFKNIIFTNKDSGLSRDLVFASTMWNLPQKGLWNEPIEVAPLNWSLWGKSDYAGMWVHFKVTGILTQCCLDSINECEHTSKQYIKFTSKECEYFILREVLERWPTEFGVSEREIIEFILGHLKEFMDRRNVLASESAHALEDAKAIAQDLGF